MESFSAKKVDLRRVYTVAFPDDMTADQALADCAVTIAVYDKSNPRFPDADPSQMLLDDPTINGAPVEIDGRIIPAGQAISQRIGGGVAGCEYVVSFKGILPGDLADLDEDVLLPVTKYAPVIAP